MEEPPYDPSPLDDDQLRRRLQGYTPPAPPTAWDRIETRLDGRRRKRRAAGCWLGAALLLGLLGSAGYARYSSPGPATRNPVATSTLPSAATIPSTPDRIHATASPGATLLHPQKNTTGASAAAPVSGPGAGAGYVHRRIAELLTKAGGVGEAAAVASNASDAPQNRPTALAGLSVPAPQLLPYARPIAPLVRAALAAPIRPPVKTTRRRFDVGLLAAAGWPVGAPDVAHGTGHAGLTFDETVDAALVGHIGLTVGMRLGRHWRLESGLWRRTAQHHTTHRADLRLADGHCLNPDDPGIKNYEFIYKLHSVAGPADVRVRIDQVDANVSMPDDEPFSLHLDATRQSVEWLLPFSVQRGFGRGPWQITARAGAALGWHARTELQIGHFSEECADLCFAVGHQPEISVVRPAGMSVQYVTGIGLQRHVTPRVVLAVEPLLTGSLANRGHAAAPTVLSLAAQVYYRL